ncbi:NPCBM/NEW2 domain-containing protein [Kitasatospora sp. NPDC056327]|uniref:NPCBM/NEW2 domain-containing protein n=1 Tax=Kitasatospora sp. NPDC056327 TaxID=3345785 RepID=UPI0035D97480
MLQVCKDGAKAADSRPHNHRDAARRLSARFVGAQERRLVVTDGSDSTGRDHADRANVRVARGSGSGPTAGTYPLSDLDGAAADNSWDRSSGT